MPDMFGFGSTVRRIDAPPGFVSTCWDAGRGRCVGVD